MAHNVELDLIKGMQFRVRTGSAHELTIDASTDVGGVNAGARPMELVLASLAGCEAMDTISMLRKMRQDVTSYSVEVRGTQAPEHPKKYTAIEVTHRLAGNGIGDANVRRALFLSMSRYCPVFAMLSPSVPVRVLYEIRDAEGAVTAVGEVRLDEPGSAADPSGQR
jgi:putative redox protein